VGPPNNAFSLAASFLGRNFFQPRAEPDERFLLQDENPLGEAGNILNQQKAEDRNMMLIFASVGDPEVSRRYRP
jgi:hypothetical protein